MIAGSVFTPGAFGFGGGSGELHDRSGRFVIDGGDLVPAMQCRAVARARAGSAIYDYACGVCTDRGVSQEREFVVISQIRREKRDPTVGRR